MRKKKDGYILVYVMFVLVFLCLAAVAVCSSALDNLTAQNDAVDRMEQRLAADSRVEKFMAEVSTGGTTDGSVDLDLELHRFVQTVGAKARGIGVDIDKEDWSNEGYNYVVTLHTIEGGIRVDATVDFVVTVVRSQVANPDYNAETNPSVSRYIDYWEISDVTSKYLSYATEYINSEGGEAE